MKAKLNLQISGHSILLLGTLLLVTDIIEGLPECPETCSKTLYVNKRMEGKFSFSPCEDQRCNICNEGKHLDIKEVHCDHLPGVTCSPSGGSVNITVFKTDKNLLPIGDIHLMVTIHKHMYTCSKGLTITSLIKPIIVDVLLKVIDVELKILGRNESDSVPVYHFSSGEEIAMQCIVNGTVPSDGSVLIYYHHDDTSNQLACSDHPQEKRDKSVIHGTTKIINRTKCELDIDNCDTFDTGQFYCHVYITGIVDSTMQEFSSDKINIEVSDKPVTPNNLILDTVPAAGAVFVALLVVVPVVIVLAIKCRKAVPAQVPPVAPPPADGDGGNNNVPAHLRNNLDREEERLNQGSRQSYGSMSEAESGHRNAIQQGYPYSDSNLSRVTSPELSLYEFTTDDSDSGRPGGETGGSRPVSFPSHHYSAVISQDQPHGANEGESDFGGNGFMSDQQNIPSRHRNISSSLRQTRSLLLDQTNRIEHNSADMFYTRPPGPLPEPEPPLLVPYTVPADKSNENSDSKTPPSAEQSTGGSDVSLPEQSVSDNEVPV